MAGAAFLFASSSCCVSSVANGVAGPVYSGSLVQAGVAGVIQLVECQLPKLDVAGSSPVARSKLSC